MSAENNAAAIMAAEGPKLARLVAEAVAVLQRPKMRAQDRGDKIIDIAEAISRTITPLSPCRNACSHCCHMATAISGFEARMIGRYVGREPAKLGRENAASDTLQAELVERYTGVACPFLSPAGKCSVYAVRPAACRLHHSVEDSPDNCDIAAHPGARVAHLNLTAVQASLASIFIAEDFGDIREFFPQEPLR